MASGLLVAGTGASLALADHDTGKPADTGGSELNSPPPATGNPEATGTSGASAPGSAPGGTGSPSKPSSQVGDGRNGVPAGGTTGTATAHETTHESTHESASPTETAPTTVTETSSKPTESASTLAPQTGAASPSEQSTGVTTHVVVAPSVPTSALPQALAAASEKLAAAVNVVTETPPTAAPVVWWPFNWWNWAIPQVVAPNAGSDGLPAPVTWQSPIPPGMQLPIPQFPTIPRDLLAPINGFSFDPFVDAVNGVLTGVNNVVTGLATAASQLPFAQITLPVVVFPGGPVVGAPNVNGGSVGAGPGLVPRPGIPAAPSPPVNPGASAAPPPPPPPGQKQQAPPAFSAGNQASVAPSYRMGYMEYLRAAGFGEVAAVAVPGFTGILILTGAGGLIGYRQARAGSTMRTGNTARFMG
jgi:hypothetical protein